MSVEGAHITLFGREWAIEDASLSNELRTKVDASGEAMRREPTGRSEIMLLLAEPAGGTRLEVSAEFDGESSLRDELWGKVVNALKAAEGS